MTMKLKTKGFVLVILICFLLSSPATTELAQRNTFDSPTSTHLFDDLTAQIQAELSSTGQSNILSVDANGNSYVACGSFNGTLTTHGITASSSRDVLLIHQSEDAELQAFNVEVDGDGECNRVVHQGNNQSTLVGWFEGTLHYRNTSIMSDGKAGFALKVNHTSGEVLDHYVVDSPVSGHSDYLYGVDQLDGGGVVVVGSSKGNLSNQSHNINQGLCSEICGIVAVLNNSLEVQEFTYVSGSKGVVAKDVAQHTVTDTLLVVGNYLDDLQFEGSSISPPSTNGFADIFVAKYVMGHGWENSFTVGGAGADVPHSITKKGTTHFITAQVTHDANHLSISSGETIISTVGGKDILILKVDGSANYKSQKIIGSSGNDFPGDLVPTSGFLAITGVIGGEFVDDDVTYGQNGYNNMLVAKIDQSDQGNDQYFTTSGSSSPEGRGNGITVLDNGTIYIGGRLQPSTTYIDNHNVGGTTSTGVLVGLYDDQDNDGIATSADNCPMNANAAQADLDGDYLGDVCDDDMDNDGISNSDDICPLGEANWLSTTGSDWDRDGCKDEEDPDIDNDGIPNDAPDECVRGERGDGTHNSVDDRDADGCYDINDDDDDGDGLEDQNDHCNLKTSVVKAGDWEDKDNDGCHDTKPGVYGEDMDDDNDGLDDPSDDCPNLPGFSTKGKFGCPDADGDSWANEADDCPGIVGTSNLDRNGCQDSDGDGYSNPDEQYTAYNGADAFPDETSQWRDQDGDGFGDNRNGFQGDECVNVPGLSLYDRFGCSDSDGDGFSDPMGDWGVGDRADRFVDNPTQWKDTDDDGFGDNISGFEGDACPTLNGNSTKDQFGCIDADGDGYSDIGSDAFPNEKSQHLDTDGDGFGDNSTGFEPDACPSLHGTSMHDRHGCTDSDGDGYSNPSGAWGLLEGADAFSADETQWRDYDEDGFGDNTSGNRADACPKEHGLSWSDRFGCLDSDNDGRSNPYTNWTTDDGADECPDDPNDACLAYIMNHPTSLITKHGGLFIPVVILAVVVFIKQKNRFGLQEQEEHPDLTIEEEVES
tara:strand:- start:2480 stop:5611 length:3132 start_codon:yes stop_codon:yes gene_type:complete